MNESCLVVLSLVVLSLAASERRYLACHIPVLSWLKFLN